MALKFSIITVCYNAENEIEKTVLSVLKQTYNNIEYLIIDGGSNDGTINIIKHYGDKIIFWISEPDKGIYDAMNKGLNHACGDYLLFLNAGDWLYDETVIAKVASAINDNATFAYGKIVVQYSDFMYVTDPALECRSQVRSVLQPATFTKLSYHKQHPFDIRFRSSADYKLYYDAFTKDKEIFQYIPMIVTNFDGETGMSKDNDFLVRKEDMEIEGRTTFYDYILLYIYTIKKLLKRKIKSLLPQKYKNKIRIKNLQAEGYEVKFKD